MDSEIHFFDPVMTSGTYVSPFIGSNPGALEAPTVTICASLSESDMAALRAMVREEIRAVLREELRTLTDLNGWIRAFR